MSLRPAAIVTGASSGIGAASAIALARAGLDVVVDYRTGKTEAEAVAEQCREAGAETVAIAADVADDEACCRLVSAALERFGRLDVLVNNAGMTRIVPAEPLESLDEPGFDRLFQVNVRSAFQMSRAAAKALKERRGAIVNVSSHSGHSGFGSSLVYAATKGALNTLTLGLARRLAPEIRVNAVCPGFVATRWLQKAKGLSQTEFERFCDGVRRATPLDRLTGPDDVADAVVWLALRAPAITGQLLVIDGGAHLAVMDPIRRLETPIED